MLRRNVVDNARERHRHADCGGCERKRKVLLPVRHTFVAHLASTSDAGRDRLARPRSILPTAADYMQRCGHEKRRSAACGACLRVKSFSHKSWISSSCQVHGAEQAASLSNLISILSCRKTLVGFCV